MDHAPKFLQLKVLWRMLAVGVRHNRAPSRARPVTTPPDDRSAVARAYQWATRIMVVSLEMVLPGLAGSWLDRWLGSLPLLTIVGFAGGTTLAVMHLIQMTRADQELRSKK